MASLFAILTSSLFAILTRNLKAEKEVFKILEHLPCHYSGQKKRGKIIVKQLGKKSRVALYQEMFVSVCLLLLVFKATWAAKTFYYCKLLKKHFTFYIYFCNSILILQ